jgi:tetratricopeptide (TPR) repeat protein
MRERSVRRIVNARVAAALALAALSGCGCLVAQTVPASNGSGSQPEQKKPAPTFRAAGIQGNIAPSGYSGGAREEEARQVASLVVDLKAANYADELSGTAKLSCDRQPELLHAALTEPSSFEANLRLGLFYLRHESPALSVKYLSLARELKPADVAAQLYLANAALEAKDYATASRLAEQGTGAEAHNVKGSVEAARGDADAALTDFKQSVALDPGASNVFAAALSVMALGLFTDAERMLVSGTSAHPDSARLWLARGIDETLQEDRKQATDSLLRAATLDPRDLLAPTLLATQAESAADLARVLPLARSLAAARPGEAIAHYDYALVLAKTNPGATDAQTNAPIEAELHAAIDAQPRFAAAHFQLGVFYMDTGDVKSGIAELSEAVRLDPEVAEWHYRLSRAYRRDQQASAAESEMQSFQKLKAKRDSGADVATKLLDGITPGALGIGASCPAVAGPAQEPN